MRNKGDTERKTSEEKRQAPARPGGIWRDIFRQQLALILTLALVLAAAGILVITYVETEQTDRNLKNMAEAIAQSPLLTGTATENLEAAMDTLRDSLENIDVISIVDADGTRLYHSNHALIGTTYDGTMPDLSRIDGEHLSYAEANRGPSGTQRRAYAVVYDENGAYAGFVLVATLTANLRNEIFQILGIFAAVALLAVLVEMFVSWRLSGKIRRELMGYEPDVFSAMYRIRDNILESLHEGILAVDENAQVQFYNEAAKKMLGIGAGSGKEENAASETAEKSGKAATGTEDKRGENGASETIEKRGDAARRLEGERRERDEFGESILGTTLQHGESEYGVQLPGYDSEILIDRIPIQENGDTVGALGILHDRTEYTRLMENLAGTRYLVDSMRANNHDFTNKLHVILGLIEMGMYEEAVNYIENITIVQRETISQVMNAIDEPAVAALLIGKIARASELNITFTLTEDSIFRRTDTAVSQDALITIIGNLLDNAFDAMNVGGGGKKELLFGIYSREGALLITVDDNGTGIRQEDLPHIFENGFSTKGDGRGTGLFRTGQLVESLGGEIRVESQEGIGSSFTVSLRKEG